MAVGMAAPAGAHGSHPGGIPETCPEVQTTQPGHLKKATTPPHGSVVHAGQIVEVTLTWDPARFSGAQLHKALDCVTVDGALAEDLSVQERDIANDGTFFYSFAVPAGLATGTDLCDRGFVSGDSPGGGFERETSNDVCLEVGPPPSPEVSPPPPGDRVPTDVLPQVGVPLAEVRPEQILLPSPPADVSQVVERDQPGTETMPLLVLDTLPRTGTGRLLVLFAGLALAAGGAAVTFSTPRRRRNLQ